MDYYNRNKKQSYIATFISFVAIFLLTIFEIIFK